MASWPAELRKRYDKEALLKDHPSIQAWYDSHRSAEKNWRDFPRFMAWRKKHDLPDNPEEWIEECLHGTTETLVRHATIIKRYVESSDFAGDKRSARERYAKSLKGFYLTHMIRLPPVKVSSGLSDTDMEVEMTASVHLEMLRKVLTCGKVSLRNKTVMMCQTQGGMDDSTFAKMFNLQAFPQLARHFGTERWEDWDEDKVPVRIDLIRPKTGVRHYTFQHHDAIMLLKQYLSWRCSKYGAIRIYPPKRPNALATSDAIILSKQGTPLSAGQVCILWKCSGIAAGVNVVPSQKEERGKGGRRRYPFHAHEARDCLKTLARRARADIAVADFCIGHSIDPNEYDKSPWDDDQYFRVEYDKIAGPYLNVFTGTERRIKKEYDRKLEKELADRDDDLTELKRQMAEMMKAMQDPKVREAVYRTGYALDPRGLGRAPETPDGEVE